MKKNTVFMLTTILLAITSCRDSEIISEQRNGSDATTRTVSDEMNISSDEAIYKAQSDFENMLMDQIVYRDSVYILNMSRDEARDLTIPDRLYVVYTNLVEKLNGKQEN